MTSKTKMIALSGLFVSIYCIFFIVSLQAGGMLESSLFFLLPLPLVVFSFIYGFKLSLIPFISTIIICLFINPFSAIFYVFGGGVIGILLGSLFKKKTKDKYCLTFIILITFIVDLFTMVIFASFINYSFSDEIREICYGVFKLFGIDFYTQSYQSKVVDSLIPLFLILLSIIEGLCIFLLSRIVLNKLKLLSFNLGSIYLVSIPKIFAILFDSFLILHILTFKTLYNYEGFIYYLSLVIFIVFYVLLFIMFVEGYLCLNLKFSNSKYRIIYILIFFVSLILIPFINILIISLLGNVFVYNEYRKILLYNNKSPRRPSNV